MRELMSSVQLCTLCKFRIDFFENYWTVCKYVRTSFIDFQVRDRYIVKQVEFYFRKYNPFYGSITIYFTIQPAIYAAISNKNARELLDHLPFIHLKKHWALQKEIQEYQNIVSKNPDDPYWATRLQRKETELQNLKIFTAMGESAPQVILALLIVIKQGSLENWILNLNPMVNPLRFLQMSTSLASTALAVTGLFTDLEVNGRTPVRSFTYKFCKILPLMFLKSIPRLFSISLLFSFASIYNRKNLLFYISYT